MRIRQKENDVIDVYTWTTGNSRKIPIFLEEAQVPYRLHMVNIRTGEQFKPEFVAICPNSKVPAIIDQDGPGGKPLSLFESGAILIYLADKYGKFIGKDAAERYRTIEWVMFQMANVGPLFGQATTSSTRRPKKCPMRSIATSRNRRASTKCSTIGSPSMNSWPATIQLPT